MCAKQSGEPSLARVELFTQNAYFAFQVIQVFLVATIGSAVTSVLGSVSKGGSNPILMILGQKIPAASNLYISYFIVQGLSVASGTLAQAVGFLLFRVLGKLLDKTPRKMYNRWASLSGVGWGSTLPVYTCITCICE